MPPSMAIYSHGAESQSHRTALVNWDVAVAIILVVLAAAEVAIPPYCSGQLGRHHQHPQGDRKKVAIPPYCSGQLGLQVYGQRYDTLTNESQSHRTALVNWDLAPGIIIALLSSSQSHRTALVNWDRCILRFWTDDLSFVAIPPYCSGQLGRSYFLCMLTYYCPEVAIPPYCSGQLGPGPARSSPRWSGSSQSHRTALVNWDGTEVEHDSDCFLSHQKVAIPPYCSGQLGLVLLLYPLSVLLVAIPPYCSGQLGRKSSCRCSARRERVAIPPYCSGQLGRR